MARASSAVSELQPRHCHDATIDGAQIHATIEASGANHDA